MEFARSKWSIYMSKYEGWYSVSDEAFYQEDEIETKDNKKYAISSGSPVEWVEEESFFFKLSEWKPLLKFYEIIQNLYFQRVEEMKLLAL